MRNLWWVSFPWYLTLKVIICVTAPALFRVPSTFLTFLGLVRGFLFSLASFISFGWMNDSVAPLSSRAFLVALSFLVYSETEALIALFQATYTESVLHAWTRATLGSFKVATYWFAYLFIGILL